jgi:hypothetical protein
MTYNDCEADFNRKVNCCVQTQKLVGISGCHLDHYFRGVALAFAIDISVARRAADAFHGDSIGLFRKLLASFSKAKSAKRRVAIHEHQYAE